MNHRALAFALVGLNVFLDPGAHAQALRLQSSGTLAAPGVRATPTSQQAADFIVAVVNSEPITRHEVRAEMQRLAQQLNQQGRPQPAVDALTSEALERLIRNKAELQFARESGIRVSDADVNQAEQSVAAQNKLDQSELYRRLAADGISVNQFRKQLRDQLTLTRVREREVDSKVRVSDTEVDQYILSQSDSANALAKEINLAQVLIAVPDGATDPQIAALQVIAQRALDRARAGEDFAALARELSQASDRANGGQLGLRSADKYPPIFVDATQALGVGELTGLVRSGAGFHILKVIEKRGAGMPATTMTQSHARHILLRLNAGLSDAAARGKLADFKKRVVAGQADFATLARENSQDTSAAQGGDLGWASPGQFVPEFEEVMNALAPGQISEPLTSRFGVHLIQLNERRNVTLSQREQRDAVREILRSTRLDEAFAVWEQDIRARAYVDVREAPQ
ncbi:MAG: hypothetical protein RIS34_56 [Pseudomonadota bacterium]|jgi:peptidyl-prolyl cis-trans isomerase SurA